MPDQVAQAAVQLAKEQGRMVFAHVSNAEGLRIAVDSGVDVIAHVPDSTEGTHPLLQEAARRGMWMVPTLDMFAQTGSRSPEFLEPIYEALNVFYEAGGKLLFGTDVGYLPDRSTQGELEALEACGMGTTEVLRMLTTAPAEALGVGSGRLAEGQSADLVVLEHSEVSSASQYAQVKATIRDGQVLWTRGSTRKN
nr:amidohydrolase family protein [Nesterenkonia alkaliphila]